MSHETRRPPPARARARSAAALQRCFAAPPPPPILLPTTHPTVLTPSYSSPYHSPYCNPPLLLFSLPLTLLYAQLEQLGGGEDTLVGSVPGALGLHWHVPPAPWAHAPSERTTPSHEQRSSAVASSGADQASSQDRRSAADGAGAWHAASSRRSHSWHEEVRVVFRNMDEAADGAPSPPLRDLLGRREFP